MLPFCASSKWVSLACAIATLTSARAGVADDKPTLSGNWSASPLTEHWSVSDWGSPCGPKPAPKGAGGGAVQIREQGGELSIQGAGRSFSSTECWEQMPGLSRSSHSSAGGGRSWRTRCTTAPNDPRHAVVVTTLSATDTSIQLQETGEYQLIIQDTTCRASVTRSRSFTLVQRNGAVPPAASVSAAPTSSVAPPVASVERPAVPEAKPASRCNGAAGEPARLEVYPSKKLLRAGDRFTFHAVVLSGDGCPTATQPTWAIVPGPLSSSASVDARGTLTVTASAHEGKLDVTASVGSRGVTVAVEVVRAEHYEALLGSSGSNEVGEADQAAVAVIAAGTIGGRPSIAHDTARERKIGFVAIAGALAGVLSFAALMILQAGRRRARVQQGPISEGASPEPPPSERSEHGGERPAPSQPPPSIPRGKVCPTCGERYEREASFCGKDATALVPLNGRLP